MVASHQTIRNPLDQYSQVLDPVDDVSLVKSHLSYLANETKEEQVLNVDLSLDFNTNLGTQ